MSNSFMYIPSDFHRSTHTAAGSAAGRSRTVSRPSSNRFEAVRAVVVRLKVRLLAAAAALLLCVGIAAVLSAVIGDGEVQAGAIRTYEHVVVQPGDSLWSIAEGRAKKSEDIRVYIEKLKKVNGLSSSAVRAGQVLQLPQ
ncbi:LysM peptidoglycan-binding domain-containing protein [Paenibacillus hodogayensis]|uniref:LysM peptidoglycan-binding domain-containing protein n=1 Tax=Paenibacillus hodogayensis TaxID=279208 RepID=A0ABV5W408_9BACL